MCMFQVEKLDNFLPFINFIGQLTEKYYRKQEKSYFERKSRKIYGNLLKVAFFL